MTLTLVGTVWVSFRLARDALDQVNVEGRERIIQEAAEALARGGERDLKGWLRKHPRPAPGIVLLVLDERGDELLGRALPREVARLLRTRPGRDHKGPPNVKPVQRTPHLVAADGSEFRLLFARAPVTVLGMLAWPGTQLAVLTIGVLASALMSLLLARYLSSPIVRVQRASRALAAGALDARVGGGFTRPRDEVGILARDFDAMAEQIQAFVTATETLLRDVSHEFRSPLARIRVALALAQRRANDEAQPDLRRIEREAERLNELVGQVMTLARLRAQTTPKSELLRLDELIAEVIEDARFEYPDARIEFVSGVVAQLSGDPQGLKSAVENVIRNALTYADRAQPIEVRLERCRDELLVRVRDVGPGVPEQDLTRIFEPFYRSDQSRDHQHNGQGIGLAITARVIQLHGGRVEARNRPEGGLEVTLALPIAKRSSG